jgi:hypothetical protein
MIERRALLIIACSTLMAASAVAVPDESPRVRAARYYAAGIETPLLELRRGALLVQTCATRLRRACSKEQRRLAGSTGSLALLDELTLFPQRPTGDVSAKNMEELKQRMAEARAALMRSAGDYDRQLMARYGAALRVCPGDFGPRYRESLDALAAADMRWFQELEGPDIDAARAALGTAESAAADELRKLPAPDCEAALILGQLLMEMMNAKLEPWTHDNRRAGGVDPQFDFDAARKPPADDTPTRDVAVSIAGNFVTVVATELQLTVFPETGPRIKAIAEAEGIREAGD